jgi:ribosome-associated translation inhibitor RaiA
LITPVRCARFAGQQIRIVQPAEHGLDATFGEQLGTLRAADEATDMMASLDQAHRE